MENRKGMIEFANQRPRHMAHEPQEQHEPEYFDAQERKVLAVIFSIVIPPII